MSVVIYKHKLLHESEIVQLLHNSKCYGVNQNRFRKPLRSSAKNVKNKYPETSRSVLLAVQFATSLTV